MQVKTYSSDSLQNSKNSQKKRYFFAGVAFLVSTVLGGFLLVALMSLMKNTDLRQQAAGGTTAIRFTTQKLDTTVGKQVTLPIELVIGSGSVAVAEVLPTFDTTFFKAVSLKASEPAAAALLPTTLLPSSIASNGTFTSLLVAAPLTTPPSGATGQGKVAVLTLQALKAGTTTIAFDQSKTRAPLFGGPAENSIGSYQSLPVTIAAPATPLPSPSPTPTPTATPVPQTNRTKINAIANQPITVRTYFTAKPGFNSTDNTNWPKVALFANNGTDYSGPYDRGSCATQLPGCGAPNKYADKLITTIEVPVATFTSDTTIPVGKLVTFPHAGDDTTMVTKLSYAFFNDYWNPGTGADRDVAVTKVEFVGPNNQVLETFTPASRSYTDDPEAGIENRFYFDKGIINDQGIKDSSQDGMVKAFDKVELETIVTNNSRATGAWSLKSEGSFNVVSNSVGKKIVAALAPTVSPTPTPTPSPTPTPTATPTPSPTTTPPPAGTPSPTSPNLLLSFKQQGITKAGISVPATVSVQYTISGQTPQTKQFAQTFTSDSAGVLRAAILPLAGVPISDATTATVFVKTPTALQQRAGTITLRQPTTALDATTPLMVGDFNRSPGQENLFNILDITLMYSFYEGLINPITPANAQLDVNHDNVFNMLDMSLVLHNFQSLERKGETP